MEKIVGKLSLKLQNIGTKSEGNYPILTSENLTEYILVRDGELEFNNPYFEPYNDQIIEVEGRVIENFITVEKIELIDNDKSE